MIGPSQRPVSDNTQHSQETDIHALCGIPTRHLRKRAAANPRVRRRCHWDRLFRLFYSHRVFRLKRHKKNTYTEKPQLRIVPSVYKMMSSKNVRSVVGFPFLRDAAPSLRVHVFFLTICPVICCRRGGV